MEHQIHIHRNGIIFVGIISMLLVLLVHGVGLWKAGSDLWYLHLGAAILFIILFIWIAEVPFVKSMGTLLYVNKAPFRQKVYDLNLVRDFEVQNPNTMNSKLQFKYKNGEMHHLGMGALGAKGKQQLIAYIENIIKNQNSHIAD